MCRHLAYLGSPLPLRALLTDPPHSLVTQAWAPRRQTHGVVNADGFGLGWYVDGFVEPARHRGTGPVWADETFTDLVRVVRTRACLAAVRSATDGMPPGTAASAPFRTGQWLFSHNGAIDDWPASGKALAERLPADRLLTAAAGTDSALLWAAVTDRLDAGADPVDALADVVRFALDHAPGRLNLLLTDGHRIAASRVGASLSWRTFGDGVVVASEPFDDAEQWRDVPEGHLLRADQDGVRLTPL
jgi:gamma-glutamyl hercynylcysteine S-oxide hydrolase